MRLGHDRPSAKYRAEVLTRTLQMLHLTSIQDRPVSGLSSSERKLLTIGVELAGNPAILFLDEPTVCRDGSGSLSLCVCALCA